jgi:hypothetical protein
MKRILFQPFDFAKWCGIGFAAFLAGHFGGGGFSPPIPLGNFSQQRSFSNQGISYDPEYLPWLIGLIIALGLLFFAFIIFVIWIRSRGIFILTDCIVRNRAAIKEPWQEYRKEGNSFFKFSLVAMVLCVFFFALIAAVFLGIAFAVPEHWRVLALVSVTALTMLVWVSVCFAFAPINYFMPMIMYAQRCGAMQALRQAVNLIFDNPLAFALFAGFAIVLFFAFVIVSTAVTCATCCLASLPYVGTVIMLPAFVWIRGFGLLFLRQFGAEFDVWREIPPTLPPPITSPLPA